MRITKFKLTINRARHIFTYNSTTNMYHSDIEDDFTLRLESFFIRNNVSIYAVKREDDQEFTVDSTNIVDCGIVTAILIDDEESIYLSCEEDDRYLDEAVIQNQRVTANNLTDIEVAITSVNPRAIRLERLLRTRTETPLQFLKKFFQGSEDVEAWNETRNTIYVDDNEVQTEMSKRRSIGDIFMILKYYYPNITFREVAKLLYVDLFAPSNNIGMRSSNCGQIRKRVWYYEEGRANFMEATQRDEYGNNREFYIINTR